jgi:hypothetical protein
MTGIVRCPLRTIALASLLLGIGLASLSARADQRVGIDSAVNPNAMGIPPGALPRRLVLGQDVVFNERITTEAGGQTQILFVDESTLSVGPNANMVIDQFVYDPNTGAGKFVASLTRGVFRFVGGKLSKQENAVTMRTPVATIGIRGGVFLADVAQDGRRLTVHKVYGNDVTITGFNGVSQTITANGFESTVSAPGASPSDPAKSPPGATAALNNQLDGRASGNGGATTVPTDVMVANSGIASTISTNITPNIQAAGQAAATQPQSVGKTVQQTVPPTTIQAGSLQGSAATATLVNPISPPTPTPPSPPLPPPLPPPPPLPVVITPSPPPPLQPVVISVAGLAKSTNGPPTAAGFIDQTAAGRIPYTTGTITYPPGSSPQNGTFTASIGGAGQVTLSPLTPGSTNAVTATAANGATAAGTATMTPDGKFFYANLTATSPGTSGDRLFVFGGVPVNSSFYAPNPNQQLFAFAVQPDAALASATSPQTIPFLPSNYGGTMQVLPGNVSPVYLTASPNQQFGSYNAGANPSGSAPHFLQASLAVNGQGGSQSSALVVATGAFSTSNAGSVVAAGPVRGTVFTSATTPPVRIDSGLATVPDGNGNNLFGGKSLSGFVLDQNQYNGGNFSLHTASASPFTPPSSTTFSYGFNQPVTAASLPSGVCTTAACRPQLVETGYFGGIMRTSAGAGTSYALTGANVVATYPSDNRVFAGFAGYDPFTSTQSGLNSVLLYFGAPGVPGVNGYGRSTYVNNQIYAATEDPNDQAQIVVTSPSGATTTTNLPTYASGSTLYPRLAMATSGTVPNNSWMPAGVTPCSCQYLQWGYWTGQAGIPNAAGTNYSRLDVAAINTWVAGQPTVNLPAAGVGTYNGAAVGTVFNSGATYLAAGGFNQMYNFAKQAGTVNITNFDGASYRASVAGASGYLFTGPLAAVSGPTSRNGKVIGSFYGPAAQETGGSFNISNGQTAVASKYLASGIFAGRQLP